MDPCSVAFGDKESGHLATHRQKSKRSCCGLCDYPGSGAAKSSNQSKTTVPAKKRTDREVRFASPHEETKGHSAQWQLPPFGGECSTLVSKLSSFAFASTAWPLICLSLRSCNQLKGLCNEKRLFRRMLGIATTEFLGQESDLKKFHVGMSTSLDACSLRRINFV